MVHHENVAIDSPRPDSADELVHLLDTMHSELASAVHDVGNPLAVISGNAQLLAELTRGMSLDADLVKSVRDIEEASTELARRLTRLTELKEVVGSALIGENGAG